MIYATIDDIKGLPEIEQCGILNTTCQELIEILSSRYTLVDAIFSYWVLHEEPRWINNKVSESAKSAQAIFDETKLQGCRAEWIDQDPTLKKNPWSGSVWL